MDIKDAIQKIETEIREEKWRPLGRELGLTDPELDALSHDRRFLLEIIHQMLVRWMEKNGSKATVENLAYALNRIACQRLARLICPVDTLVHDLNEAAEEVQLNNSERLCVNQMRGKLFHQYCNSELPGFPWDDNFFWPMETLYVKLTIHEMDLCGNASPGKPLELTDIFQQKNVSGTNVSIIKRYLIEGGPGYGKTTLLQKIAYDWTQNKPYVSQKFDLVTILHLRNLRGSLKKMLVDDIGTDEAEKTEQLLRKIQSRVLLLLDGFDELSSQEEHTELLNLLAGQLFPQMVVFVTSRLKYTDMKKTTGWFWNRRIEIIGIAEEQRIRFLTTFLKIPPDQVPALEEKLSLIFKKPVYGLFECPLFLILIGKVMEEERVTVVSTKTELYKTVFTFAAKRGLMREKRLNKDAEFDLFSQLQQPSRNDQYFQLMVDFGKFALQMIKDNKLLFHRTEVMNCCKNNDIFLLGFLKPTVKNTKARKIEPEFYEPIHKSFLEFLAALHLSWLASKNLQQDFDKELRKILESKLPPESYSFLLSFLGGLLGDKSNWLLQVLNEAQEDTHLHHKIIRDIISDMDISDELMQNLLPFIPNSIQIDSKSNTDVLLRTGIKCHHLKRLTWNMWYPFPVPEATVPQFVVITNIDMLTKIDKTDFPKYIECEDLICNVPHTVSAADGTDLETLIGRIKSKTYSYQIMGGTTESFLENFVNAEDVVNSRRTYLNMHSVEINEVRIEHMSAVTKFIAGSSVKKLFIRFTYKDSPPREPINQLLTEIFRNRSISECRILLPDKKESSYFNRICNGIKNSGMITEEMASRSPRVTFIPENTIPLVVIAGNSTYGVRYFVPL